MTDYEIKKEICEMGRRIYQNGFVAANDGNITVKINDNEFWATPTGVSKGFMTPDMLCKVDGEGRLLEGRLKPSSELKMHMRVYRERPDVMSVVHAHPPIATGFAIAGIPLNKFIMPEAIITLGTVPIADYGTPSTEEIPDAVSKHLQTHDAFLLENHGALTVGNSLLNAYFKMESVEFYAKLSLYARLLGGEHELNCAQVSKLMQIREKFGTPGKNPGCPECVDAPDPTMTPSEVREQLAQNRNQLGGNDIESLVESITKKVMAEMNK